MADNSPLAPARDPSIALQFRVLGALDLRRPGDGELRALIVQPKRLALFAYLALSTPPRFHRRDSLLALFWPESNDEQARRSLRQALHFIRQSLGPGVLLTRGDEEVGIDFNTLWCDAREFDRAVDQGLHAEGLALYRGHLLEGFHVPRVAPELEQWLDEERERLRRRAAGSASALADQAEREGNPTLAAQWLRERLRFEPGDEPTLRRLVALLHAAGDRAAALRAYDEFSRRLAADGMRPTRESISLSERLRASRGIQKITEHFQDAGPSSDLDPTPVSPAARTTHSARRGRRMVLFAGVPIAIAAIVIAMAYRDDSRVDSIGRPPVVLAVGAVEDRSGSDSVGTTRVLRDLLATDLARLSAVTVVSHGRLHELVLRLGSRADTADALIRAARNAGATEVLEGELHRRAPGRLRLDLRRVGVNDGVIRRAYTAEASNLFALVAAVTEHLARDLGTHPPTTALAGVTTTSLVARGFYEEGVRAYYQGDPKAALRLFRAALAEDSTFAMAAYFAARSARGVEPAALLAYAAQAVRMSHRATERERLLIAIEWADASNNPSLPALADSLSRRYVLEPEEELAVGRALAWSGDFSGAIPRFRRAAQRDSVSLASPVSSQAGRQQPCTACEAQYHLISTYTAIDSAAAAERVTRELIRRQPRSPAPWMNLAVVLAIRGRHQEARAALRTRQALFAEPFDDVFDRVIVALRAGDFAETDRLLEDRVRNGSPSVQTEALWWQVVSLRNQGRLVHALAVATRLRDMSGLPEPTTRLALAQVLFELGRAGEAAAHFSTATRTGVRVPAEAPDNAPGLQARTLAWTLTHTAVAYAAAGDTVQLARLVDSVHVLGTNGAYWRDRALHHHLRGLLHLARGRRDDAVTELRRAIVSPTQGYTRSNFELGRLLLTLGRGADAVAVLAPALRGDLQASNYYVTHAELHEALARAFEMAGQRDSARVHHAWVENAWRFADPAFAARRANAYVGSRPRGK